MLVNMEAREFGRQQTITELEKSRKQLKRYSDQLEQTVMLRTDELSRKNAFLEQGISERCRAQAALDVARSVGRDLAALASDVFFKNRRSVTLSFGVACSVPLRTMSPEELIAADKALCMMPKKGAKRHSGRWQGVGTRPARVMPSVLPLLIPGLMQPIIKPLLTDQFRMGATLDDAAPVENEDAVCSANR